MKNNAVLAVLKKPLFQASVIAAGFVLWMATGPSSESDGQADNRATSSTGMSSAKAAPIAKVRAEQFNAELIARSINLYGRTAADRQTNLGAEYPGRVADVLAQRGSFVRKGDVIVKMEVNDLPQQLDRAQALYKQRQIEFNGAEQLAQKGFQGKARLAAAAAALSDAKANVYSLQLQLDKTTITAPISGILNDRHVEVGDFLAKGNPIATIADIDPLIVRADVTEEDVRKVALAQLAQVRLASGELVSGKVRYISRVANAATNTFPIEVAVANPDFSLSAGGSAEIVLPLTQEWAVKLSSATLTLDEVGVIGVKTVVDEHVVFIPIDILKADGDGTWLTGLGKSPVVITVGQGFVRAGDKVEAVLTEAQ